MSDVFISYSRKDKVFVQTLHAALCQHDRDTWVDWEDIPLTADWWDEIEHGIGGTNAFIFVISPDSIVSKVCRQELDYAIAQNKRLVPIVHREGFDTEQTHPALSRHNWLFFREQDDFGQAFQSLLKAISTDLDYVRSHTRLFERAIEWDHRGRDESFLLRGKDLAEARQWLLQGTAKEPPPTVLHTDYILTSGKVENSRQDAEIKRQHTEIKQQRLWLGFSSGYGIRCVCVQAVSCGKRRRNQSGACIV
jgi:TIR domain